MQRWHIWVVCRASSFFLNEALSLTLCRCLLACLRFPCTGRLLMEQLFIEENGGADNTAANALAFYGEGIHKTNMSELKKSG